MALPSEDFPRPDSLLEHFDPPIKTLLGPGPSNLSSSVRDAATLPMVGHMHAECFKAMDDIKVGLQYAFQTRNTITLAISATGHGGMETCLCNLLERGDKVLILVNGIWGERASDMATRYGAEVVRLERSAGENFPLEVIEEALASHRPAVLFVVHGESSTGVLQPLDRLGPLCHRYNCLLAVDAVASLGGAPLLADRWELDAVYTGSQKVLGAPPGMAPITFSPRAWEKVRARTTPPSVFYFDLNLIANYWGCDNQPRRYHHTAPVTLLYSLREALSQLAREGLTACWRRHAESTRLLHDGLPALGVSLFVRNPEARLPTISALVPSSGVDMPRLIKYCMEKHRVEIAGGLGPTVGRILRLGLMGTNATPSTVTQVLNVLREALADQNALPSATDPAKL